MKILKKYIKIGDILLAVVLAALSLVGILLFRGEEGGSVVVRQNGQVIYSAGITKDYDLNIDAEYHNTIHIKNGEVWFEDSDCPNGDCVSSGKISRTGQMIACLPNRVSVSIEGESEVDVVAK